MNAPGSTGTDPAARGPDGEHAESARALADAMAREFRFDPLSLGTRLGALVVAYALLARAIREHALPAPLVAVPAAAEILAVMWGGVYLARRTVECPVFARDARGLFAPLFWTTAIGAAALASVTVEAAGVHAATLRAAGPGLALAVAAILAAMAASTTRDVRRWRRTGGVFVWTATLGGGLRLVLGAVLAVPIALLLFLLVPLAELAWPHPVLDGGALAAWGIFALLLVLEVGVLALAYAMRRFPARIASPPAPAQ